MLHNISIHNKAICLALIIWLFANLSGMHVHYCFDGQEPLMSTHFDVLGGHPVHAAEDNHEDVDDENFTPVFFKIFHLDILLLCAALLLVLLPFIDKPRFTFRKNPPLWRAPQQLRPPLRAPPVQR